MKKENNREKMLVIENKLYLIYKPTEKHIALEHKPFRIKEQKRKSSIGTAYTLRGISYIVPVKCDELGRKALDIYGVDPSAMDDNQINALEMILTGKSWPKIRDKLYIL